MTDQKINCCLNFTLAIPQTVDCFKAKLTADLVSCVENSEWKGPYNFGVFLFVQWVTILHLAWGLGLSDELLSCFLKRYFWSYVAEIVGVKLADAGWKKCHQDVNRSLC